MELVTMFLGTLHYVGVVAILFSIQVVVCTSWNSAECKNPFNCGLIKNVSYPFHQIRGCGKPGFEFVCPDDGSPVITIGSRSYQVLVYNTSLQSLTIAPVSKYGDVLCPENLSNISLNLSPFYPASNTNNISLYYDCPANATQYEGLYKHQFNCSTSGGRNDVGYFVVTSSFSQLSVAARDAMASCNSYVLLPAFVSILKVLEHNPGSINLRVVIENGFGVQWREDGSLSASGSSGIKLKVILGVTGSVASIMGVMCILYLVVFRNRGPASKEHKDNFDAFIKTYGSRGPRRYSYNEIKKMTNNFLHKLGQGGYGSVYKGELPDASLLAVKLLSGSKGDGEEFLNEVASISRTSHVNIVTLLGFCYEKRKRALVYEFMPNGSLDKFIYRQGCDTSRQLEWKILYDIALGIARGLEYLHQGCSTRILHFDIKPHNILLDDNFCPKISDFGLSKLCERKESMISLTGARGTAGYIAPEVFCRNFGGVSHKSDVYSYGMMVLEMVGGRKNFNFDASQTSEIYFPSWIYNHLDHAMNSNLDGVTVEDEITRKLTLVSLWCIQSVPSSSTINDQGSRNVPREYSITANSTCTLSTFSNSIS